MAATAAAVTPSQLIQAGERKADGYPGGHYSGVPRGGSEVAMEGRTQLICRDCGRRESVEGEIPAEYFSCFMKVVQEGGWVVAPGSKVELLCGPCLATYMGSETKDDEEKI